MGNNTGALMESFNKQIIVVLIIMITVLSGFTFISCQRRTGGDMFEEGYEESRANQSGKQSPSPRFFWRSQYYYIIVIPLAFYIGILWKKHGNNFWMGFFVSLILSPIFAIIILYFLGMKSQKELAQEKAYETMDKYGYKLTINNYKTAYTENRQDIIRHETNMVSVKGGKFRIGENNQQEESPQTAEGMIIDDFFLSKNLVTQRLWREVMGDFPSAFRGDDLPVESVDWYNVIVFCNKLSEIEGLTCAYKINKEQYDDALGFNNQKITVTMGKDALGYRLPTEAEWEYAASGGQKRTKSMYAGSDLLDEVAWYQSNSGGKTMPVRMKKPNELGFYDMSGNVWEWCWDWYEEQNSSTDNTTIAKGKVLRGGSWIYGPIRCRVNHRFFRVATGRYKDVGFRIARNIKES